MGKLKYLVSVYKELRLRVYKELRLIGSTFLPSVGQVRVHVYERPFMEKEQEAFGGQSVHRCRS